MKITVGNLEVLGNGSIISQPEEPVDFNLGDNLSPFVVRIIFRNDGQNQASRIDSALSEGRLNLSLFNFNSSMGTGNIQRLDMGRMGTKSIFLSLWVVALGAGGHKLLHYTWYSREAAQ